MFMRLHKRYISDTPQEAVMASHKYFQVQCRFERFAKSMGVIIRSYPINTLHTFQDLAKKNKKVGVGAFLKTSEGEQFMEVFRKLRLPQLVNHSMDMEMLITGKR